jgi:nitroreductase
MKTFLDLAKGRRSIRRYTADEVMPDDLAAMLEAGHLAPSGNNTQPWRFIIIRDAAQKARLAEVAGNQRWMLAAPLSIAVVADPTVKLSSSAPKPDFTKEGPAQLTALIKSVRDATIAADHIVLAATDLGYGTCWVAKFEQDAVREALDVPPPCYVVALITIGRPAETPAPTPRYPLAELTFAERYGRRRSTESS